jgi:hypothetical protein
MQPLIIASRSFWQKWPMSGKGSLRRRRTQKVSYTFGVPRQTPATKA